MVGSGGGVGEGFSYDETEIQILFGWKTGMPGKKTGWVDGEERIIIIFCPAKVTPLPGSFILITSTCLRSEL